MPVLLEPISIHSIPFGLHCVYDGIKFPLASHVGVIRVEILFQVVAIEVEY